MVEALIQIQANHFTAGLVAQNGLVVTTAPILSYMKGWNGEQLVNWCKKKKWKIVKVY